MGTWRPKGLQDAANAHGADSLSFEILERIDEESAFVRTERMKDRAADWRERLGAERV